MLQIVDRDGRKHGPFKSATEARNYVNTRWPTLEQDDNEDSTTSFDVTTVEEVCALQ